MAAPRSGSPKVDPLLADDRVNNICLGDPRFWCEIGKISCDYGNSMVDATEP